MSEYADLIKQYANASALEKQRICHELMRLFEHTANMLERNRIAFFFADHQMAAAIPRIVHIIQTPKYSNQIGSLIYALRCYPAIPTNYLDDFVPIVANGNFEAAHESYLLIAEQMDTLNQEDMKRLRSSFTHMYESGCVNADLVLDMLDEMNR